MFKKIQNYLLLHHPLLWNTKFVPVLAIAIVINMVFFFGGYIYGAIDFNEIIESYRYDESTPVLVVFLGVILSLLTVIGWIVFYVRNNAFKTFYPKNRTLLFKEWLLIFVLCIVSCSYFVSFMYAFELRARHYYNETQLVARLDVISKASVFADGGYERDEDTIIKNHNRKRSEFTYSGKTYKLSSLLNKTMETFSLQGDVKDSLTKRKVRSWLVENRKDSVYNILKKVHIIAGEHKLKSNITPEQWLELVYDYPDFKNNKIVGIDNFSPVYAYDNEQYYAKEEYEVEDYVYGKKIDLSINNRTIREKDTTYTPKYYVPLKQLKTAYGKMSKAYYSPDANLTVLGTLLYFALFLSMLLFSFRVTSARNWLIAGVSGGVMVVATALLTLAISNNRYGRDLIIRNEDLFITFWAIIVSILLVCYGISLQKKHKSISGIIVNVLLWLLPALLPVVYSILHQIAESFNTAVQRNNEYITIEHPIYSWLNNYFALMVFLNLLLVVIYMYFFTISIKRWKGIAEG